LAVVGLMLVAGLPAAGAGKSPAAKLLECGKVLGLWLLIAAVTFVVLWPGMWVAPGRMLFEVYGNAFSYAFQGARLDALQGAEPEAYGLTLDLSGMLAYFGQWLLRSTPLTWLGILLAVPVLIGRSIPPALKQLIGYLAFTALLFILMFGIAQGRDSAHYILTGFVCLDVIAGLGWGYGLGLLAGRLPGLNRPLVGWPVYAGLIAVQIACVLPFSIITYSRSCRVSPANRTVMERARRKHHVSGAKTGCRGGIFVYAGMGRFVFLRA
jgi:hypothetical protein